MTKQSDPKARLVKWFEAVHPDDTVLFADGFEAALVGVGRAFTGPMVAVYDHEACIAVLMSRDGMDRDEAEEFFDFNVIGAYVGPQTPIFLLRPPSDVLAPVMKPVKAKPKRVSRASRR